MKLRRAHLRYFIADAVDEWRHSPGVNLLATATLTAALFVAGLLLLGLSNLGQQLDRWGDDLRVQVYMEQGASSADRARIEQALAGLAAVERIDYVDQDEALRRFRQAFGETVAGLTSELPTNPLPPSFEVFLKPAADAAEAASAITERVRELSGVEEVRFDRDWLDRLSRALRVARGASLLIALLIFAAVALVMASVLRLAVYARRDEIEIVQLVGATPGFVRGPFLIAGLVQGFVASVVALALVEIVRRSVLSFAGSSPAALISLVTGRALAWGSVALLLLSGLVVSFVGSYFAVRSSLGFEGGE